MATFNEVQVKFKNYYYDKSDIAYIFEDEHCIAFDVTRNQQAPVHFLVAPKKVIPTLSLASAEDEKYLGHLLLVAKNLALQKGLDSSGYHVVVDEDHKTNMLKSLHLFGRALHHMLWPSGGIGSRL